MTEEAPIFYPLERSLDALRAELRATEARIQAAVAAELLQLRQRTGLTPHTMEVRMVEVTGLGDRTRNHTVGEVRLDVYL